MADQTIIQVRVDQELKEQAAEIFDSLGIDIPTAVRMFFKATVRMQGLPFSTALNSTAPMNDYLSDGGMTIGDRHFSAEETDAFMKWAKSALLYDDPSGINDVETIVVLPLTIGGQISPDMYAQLVTKVPAGSVTCWEHIYELLSRIYNQQVQGQPDSPLPKMDTKGNRIPYWRVVSKIGVLGEYYAGSKELQREQLIGEGVPVVQRGSVTGSYKVDDYKNRMFNFRTLKIVRR
ncbi:MAG: type II toxin-antitoxin system RelB/DinJ family antitoxin [Ruminococcus sp.]|uniref:type II toxin-antitoxin system RelB/DinJ family antitoxin n=1 Tax=Ruminococcus sp. TaxID=41978 RepID=UPI0025F8DAA0|nr:type II toxin-antitoxin system RelB/DinJ family antitoxin [Ruminococcus sp.]MCR5599936.1 type II toxin-antitoxin system RelB/DinJ family antitoxin [Ruminococcus sp.]